MFWRHFLVKVVAAVLIIGLLVAGGVAIRHWGWSEGYAVGRSVAEGGTTAPYGPDYPGWFHGPKPFIGGFGLFFMIGIGLLLLLALGRIFSFRARKVVYGPRAKHWAEHWHGPPPGPWHWGPGWPADKKAEEAGPEAESGDTEAPS